MSNIILEINQNIATLTFDLQNEKINKLSFEILKEFKEILNTIENDSSIKALVIDSAKKNIFIVMLVFNGVLMSGLFFYIRPSLYTIHLFVTSLFFSLYDIKLLFQNI